jgi:hypothetical protein
MKLPTIAVAAALALGGSFANAQSGSTRRRGALRPVIWRQVLQTQFVADGS